MKAEIEKLVENDDWPAARRLIQAELLRLPEDHWLLTRLGLTYYEEGDYAKALQCAKAAFALSSACPLVLWDFAGTLQMLEQHNEAIDMYNRILIQSFRRLVHGRCGEPKQWARGLISDCYFRISRSLKELGAESASHEAFTLHLDPRGPGCRSIYPLHTLHKIGKTIRNKRPGLTRRCSRPVTPAIAAAVQKKKRK